jgi:hypothetical protein
MAYFFSDKGIHGLQVKGGLAAQDKRVFLNKKNFLRVFSEGDGCCYLQPV